MAAVDVPICPGDAVPGAASAAITQGTAPLSCFTLVDQAHAMEPCRWDDAGAAEPMQQASQPQVGAPDPSAAEPAVTPSMATMADVLAAAHAALHDERRMDDLLRQLDRHRAQTLARQAVARSQGSGGSQQQQQATPAAPQALDDASASAIAAAALAVNAGDPSAALVDLLRVYLVDLGAHVCR